MIRYTVDQMLLLDCWKVINLVYLSLNDSLDGKDYGLYYLVYSSHN